MQSQHTMTNLSTLLLTQKIPTPKPPPQREGAFEVAPHAHNAKSAVCHTTIPRHT
ncbi:hypothetical protein [Helicobacter macacae]|uniref:hypothetical protein n=1 Tax=Helicobacter macacae TaxID=398626 RepID=UPI0012EBDA52|nr:hypothetical protein [Helicobacter macacae]